ncbi:MAG: cobalamin biosynthesis protein [Paraglaciecola sp.]|uniref:cobalamin biosynthesis protein CobD/CbiB n=1 Tax=Paraglaciecola sp. TaxID=1920173 RepID=UPI0032976DC2
MNSVVNTLVSEQLLPFWVLLLVVFTERYLPWPDKYHPVSFMKALTVGMQAKVLSNDLNSSRQQKLSGSLACIVLLFPFYVILALFTYLSEYPIFFEALMLLIALRFQDMPKQTAKVTAALSKQQKMLARHAVSQIVIRKTEKMSPMGIVKANIESLLLRFSYQYCSVIFWYLLTGGVGALLYRFVYEMSLSWNIKLERFKYFGQPVRYLSNVLQWFPSKLASLSIVLAVNISLGTKALFQKVSYQCDHLFVLNLCGSSLGIELGGPAYYGSQKIRTTKCGGKRQIILADNSRTLAAINRATWVWLTVYFLGCAWSFSLAQ